MQPIHTRNWLYFGLEKHVTSGKNHRYIWHNNQFLTSTGMFAEGYSVKQTKKGLERSSKGNCDDLMA
jgi:hypothetical protein